MQPREEVGRGLPVAHEPMRHDGRVEAAGLAQRPGHQLLRDPHAEPAADQLVPDEPLAVVELAPGVEHRRALLVLAPAPQGQQVILDPLGKRPVARALRRREQQRDRLGDVADGVIRLLEQPVLDPRRLGRPGPHPARGHDLPRLPADQEIHRPRRVGGRRLGEVTPQRLDLDARLRRLVQEGVKVGKSLHSSGHG